MNSPSVGQPLPPPESIEDAIIVASLAHLTAKTVPQRAEAWARLMALKAERERVLKQGRAA